MNRDEARQEVAKIVCKYQSLSASAIKSANEQATKQGFILPLFRCLGWDPDDTTEISPEEAASNGRVDYAFKLNGVSQFYLEAKKFSVDLNNPEFIKQAVTYAYNKGVTWAILTDFQGIRVYNSNTGKQFLNLEWSKYATSDYDRLWLLSKESLQTGALNEEAKAYGALPPSIPVEQKLFKQLRAWREGLFNQLIAHNEQLKVDQIDEVIQRLFNRLIFIRTAEDRHIEENHLKAAVHQWEAAHHKKDQLLFALRGVFRYFDGFYDSELFELHITDSVFIEEPSIRDILIGLYEIPGGLADYDFSIIDADVLGAVYEQYLGYVANIIRRRVQETQSRLALGYATDSEYEVTAKKQRRKEQGIYYTPKFVTDYIVQETVGRYLQEHNFNENMGIKILDPACGSGSFLIRAFDELLAYHAKESGKSTGELTQFERLRILTANIHGIDLDRQAVEIARLNMLLRSLAKRELLPGLKDNIKQGNSLISGADEELKGYFGGTWQEKRPFNWGAEFKDVMARGGFDVIIGNPPYVRIQSLPKDEAEYYRSHFDSAYGSFDLYVLFIEQAIKLLKLGGRLGLITSGKFLKSDYGKKIQQIIHENCIVEEIVDLSAQQVFAEATTYPVILIFRKGVDKKTPLEYIFVPADSVQQPDLRVIHPVIASQEAITKGMWPLSDAGDSLLAKLNQKAVPLSSMAARIFQGLITSSDKVYLLHKRSEPKGGIIRVYSKATNSEHELEETLLKPFLTGQNIKRYYSESPKELLLFPYSISNGQATLIDPIEFQKTFPKAWAYLELNKTTLEERENGKLAGERWYAFGRTQNLAIQDQRKLALPSTVKRLMACYDTTGAFYLDNVRVNGILLRDTKSGSYEYLAALLNSRLLHWAFARRATAFANGWLGANKQFIEHLPIHQIDFSNPTEKAAHDRFVVLVERMLDLNKKLAPIRDVCSQERNDLIAEIDKTDKEIDSLVYRIYGLTDDEVVLVEGGVK